MIKKSSLKEEYFRVFWVSVLQQSMDILLRVLAEFKGKTTMFLIELHRERGKVLAEIQYEGVLF